jgi:hypothetical protein
MTFYGLLHLSRELENPYGQDFNDIDLSRYQDDLHEDSELPREGRGWGGAWRQPCFPRPWRPGSWRWLRGWEPYRRGT